MSIGYRNLADVVAQLRAAGLDLAEHGKTHGGTCAGDVYVESAKPVRCDTTDKPKKKSGAYSLHELHFRDGSVWLSGAYWTDHSPNSQKIEINKECPDCGADIPL